MQLPIRAICVFHAAAKGGSVSKAAAQLGVTPSAVSQQIQLLEVQFGTSLIVKAGRHIALTEAGSGISPPSRTRSSGSQRPPATSAASARPPR